MSNRRIEDSFNYAADDHNSTGETSTYDGSTSEQTRGGCDGGGAVDVLNDESIETVAQISTVSAAAAAVSGYGDDDVRNTAVMTNDINGERDGEISSGENSVNDGGVIDNNVLEAVDMTAAAAASSGGSGGGLAVRLNEIFIQGDDGDLLMQQSVRESNFLQWIQALDWQVIGACRADERLKPLLKINAVDAAEDRLLAHLSQHFEASEVGLLARCLCVPLVSMRVGKVIKQGSLLCPTHMRGTLNLTLLPSSDLRLSFIGDSGQTERLATLSDASESSIVTIEKIPADQSGRSFFVKLHDREAFYFWCSERSELLGIDLLSKMNDFLERKPTLAELTGISKSRLECFATHLRAYLAGPTASSIQANSAAFTAPLTDVNQDSTEPGQSPSTSVRSLRTRQNGCQVSKGNTQYQVSLSPRPGSFKEGLPKTLASLRSISKDKLRRRGDLHLLSVDSSFLSTAVPNIPEKSTPLEASGSSSSSPLDFLESSSPNEMSHLPPITSLFSPYYCWCPPCASPSITPLMNRPTSFSEPFSLPPLSTLLPGNVPPLDLTGLPPFEFPALLSDPFPTLPFTKQCSQPFPAFTPLMCDPIVHIPVLDICSLGQGYLVSAGPGNATSIPPLHPKIMCPIMSESESLLEKGARETLRLLIGSSTGQPNASLIGVFPSVLSNDDQQGVVVTGNRGLYSGISDVLTNEDNQGIVVTGSRGLYSGISDVNAMVNNFTAMGLSSISERSMRLNSLQSFSTSTTPDVFEQASCDPDHQNSTFMSREDKED